MDLIRNGFKDFMWGWGNSFILIEISVVLVKVLVVYCYNCVLR